MLYEDLVEDSDTEGRLFICSQESDEETNDSTKNVDYSAFYKLYQLACERKKQKYNLEPPTTYIHPNSPPIPYTLVIFFRKFHTPGSWWHDDLPDNHPDSVALKYPPRLPAPPYGQPNHPSWNKIPPRPFLTIISTIDRIVLSWRLSNMSLSPYEKFSSFEVYMCQETKDLPLVKMWKKIETMKFTDGPKTCTSTNLTNAHRYYFAVRGIDVKSRAGPFSVPKKVNYLKW